MKCYVNRELFSRNCIKGEGPGGTREAHGTLVLARGMGADSTSSNHRVLSGLARAPSDSHYVYLFVCIYNT